MYTFFEQTFTQHEPYNGVIDTTNTKMNTTQPPELALLKTQKTFKHQMSLNKLHLVELTLEETANPRETLLK